LLDFLRKLFASDFMPHAFCLRDASLIRLHLSSDAVIAASYFAIPIALTLLVRKRRDLGFSSMFLLFGVFILGCGITHVLGVVTLWYPIYRVDGVIKAMTALASMGTAVLLFKIMPNLLAVPSPQQLRAEIVQRERAEQEVKLLNRELEERVNERTNALKDANRRIAESEQRFRSLAEAVPNLLWSTAANGPASYLSPRYEEYTGVKAERLVGDKWEVMVHPDDRERVRTVWAEAVRTGQSYETEYRLRRHDRVYRWFVARGVPIVDESGQITQWFGSSTDIEDLKRTEAALRRSNEELEQFAYAAAHDLQEPLRNVANSVGMLRRVYGSRLEEAALVWIDASVEGARRMHEMVKDLLAYSRTVETGERNEAVTDADAAVRSAVENLSATVSESDATIETDLLPRVRIKETHLVQLFQNLVGNSLKYRRPDVRPIVRISAALSGDDWEFTVCDNGIGFDPAYADKIFGVFKRLNRRDEYPGNGIGLAICARIVAHYGGRIRAHGRPGEGATFRFTLPAHDEAR
jgi:PAS domain S-box-containing protein